MKALSVQIQPGLAVALDVAAVEARFNEVASNRRLVSTYHFDRGTEQGEYLNFTFDTEDVMGLWELIQATVYGGPEFATAMQAASIATCEGDHGWDDYLLLFHYDPAMIRDAL